jgi:hypothetical protein
LYTQDLTTPKNLVAGKYALTLRDKQSGLTTTKEVTVEGYSAVSLDEMAVNDNWQDFGSEMVKTFDIVRDTSPKVKIRFEGDFPKTMVLIDKPLIGSARSFQISESEHCLPRFSSDPYLDAFECSYTLPAMTNLYTEFHFEFVHKDDTKFESPKFKLNRQEPSTTSFISEVHLFSLPDKIEISSSPSAGTAIYSVDRKANSYYFTVNEFFDEEHEYHFELPDGLRGAWVPENQKGAYTVTSFLNEEVYKFDKVFDPTGYKEFSGSLQVKHKSSGKVTEEMPFVLKSDGPRHIYLEKRSGSCASDGYANIWFESDTLKDFYEDACMYFDDDVSTESNGQKYISIYVSDDDYDPEIGRIWQDGSFEFKRFDDHDWDDVAQNGDSVKDGCIALHRAKLLDNGRFIEISQAIAKIMRYDPISKSWSLLGASQQSLATMSTHLLTGTYGASGQYRFEITDNEGTDVAICSSTQLFLRK